MIFVFLSEEMAEQYRKCQARRGRSGGGGGTLPSSGTGGYQNQRRRSRAVLYHLSGQFEKQNRANRAKTKLQSLNKVCLLCHALKPGNLLMINGCI